MAKVMNTNKRSDMCFSELKCGDLFLFNGQNYMKIGGHTAYNAVCFEDAEIDCFISGTIVLRLSQAITLEND